MQQTPEEYHQELVLELETLKEKQEKFPTKYKERRIEELTKRLRTFSDS